MAISFVHLLRDQFNSRAIIEPVFTWRRLRRRLRWAETFVCRKLIFTKRVYTRPLTFRVRLRSMWFLIHPPTEKKTLATEVKARMCFTEGQVIKTVVTSAAPDCRQSVSTFPFAPRRSSLVPTVFHPRDQLTSRYRPLEPLILKLLRSKSTSTEDHWLHCDFRTPSSCL